MNELLVNDGVRSKWPRITGPGPQTLIGNDDTSGFYGEVESEDFITGNALASALSFKKGTSQNSNVAWMKFVIDDMIYFVPKKSLRHSVSHDDINEVGAVHEEATVEIGGYLFSVGLLGSLGPDVSGFDRREYDSPVTYGSEWNRLMYKVAATISADVRDSQIGDN